MMTVYDTSSGAMFRNIYFVFWNLLYYDDEFVVLKMIRENGRYL